jgi:DNA polymerase (family 10)
MTNGMDDLRALAHARRVLQVSDELAEEFGAGKGPQWARYERAVREGDSSATKPTVPFRLLSGVEVDILADGSLDLADETLAQLNIVVASVHSHFNQTTEEMTARVMRATENPYVHILGHATGRKVLQREPYKIDLGQLLPQAAKLGVAVEHNAHPARADLNDLNLRLAKELGCKLVVNSDAHETTGLDVMADGIVQLRRSWMTAKDLLNAQPVESLLVGLKRVS